MEVEWPLIRVPFEALKRAAKERKAVVDETTEAITQLQAQSADRSSEEHIESLTQLLSKLQGLKRKLADVSKAEKDEAHRCRARLEHLHQRGLPAKDQVIEWNKARLERLMVEHLLRSGYAESAGLLVSEAHYMADLVDTHIFVDARKVLDTLRQHDCREALAWCKDHGAKLKKIKSKLEFKLRVQVCGYVDVWGEVQTEGAGIWDI